MTEEEEKEFYRRLASGLSEARIEPISDQKLGIDGYDCWFCLRHDTTEEEMERITRDIACVLGVDSSNAVYPEDDVDLGYPQSVYFFKPRKHSR